jgi:hypothetical protein
MCVLYIINILKQNQGAPLSKKRRQLPPFSFIFMYNGAGKQNLRPLAVSTQFLTSTIKKGACNQNALKKLRSSNNVIGKSTLTLYMLIITAQISLISLSTTFPVSRFSTAMHYC